MNLKAFTNFVVTSTLRALFIVAVLLLHRSVVHSAEPPAPITSINELHQLSPEDSAKRRDVELTATVTFVDPDWMMLFVQDASSGTFVSTGVEMPNCKLGDIVEIRGFAESGRYSPLVYLRSMTVKGFGKLPDAVEVTNSEIWTGKYDGLRVKHRGYVMHHARDGDNMRLELAEAEREVRLIVQGFPTVPAADLDFAEVEVSGPTSVSSNEGRKVTGIELWVPAGDHFKIIRTGPQVARDLTPMSKDYFSKNGARDINASTQPVLIRGTVLHASTRYGIKVHDGSVTTCVVANKKLLPAVGSEIEAMGWPRRTLGANRLVSSRIKILGKGTLPAPIVLNLDQARQPAAQGKLVTMEGILRHRVTQDTENEWILEEDKGYFEAALPPGVETLTNPIAGAGTTVRLTGVLHSDNQIGGHAGRTRLLLRSSSDIEIISAPPWPASRVLRALSITLGLHVLGLVGLAVLYHRLRRRSADLSAARTSLETANRELEARVESRTATLTAANNSLRESEERFRQLATHIDEIFWMSTPDHSQLLYLSPSFERICGRPVKEVYDAPGEWLNLIHPDDRADVFQAALQQPLVNGYEIEYRIVRPDGTLRWLNDRAFPIRDNKGVIFRVAGIAADITARKKSEEEMREQNLALSNAMPGISRLTPDGHYLTVNSYYAELQGSTPEELVGTHFSATVHPEDMLTATRTFERMMAEGKAEAEIRGVRRDGSIFWKQVMLVRIASPGGKTTAFHCMIRDITVRKRDEMLIEGQKSVLEMIADGAPLAETLVSIARFVESQSPKSRVGILLATEDGKYLRNGAAPSLPADLAPLTERLPIDANSGSCGSCAYLKHRVIVADLANDPLFSSVKTHYITHGLLASVSVPVLGSRGEILGTICLFFNTPRRPTADEEHLLHLATQIAAIAIERDLTQNAERLAQERYQSIVHNANDAVITFDDQQRIEVFNHAAEIMFGLAAKEAIGRTISDFVPSLDVDAVQQRLRTPHSSASQPELAEPLACRRHSSEEFPVEASLSQSAVRGRTLTTVILRDLTEKQRAEKTRHQLESRLRQAQKMEAIGTLAGGIAHDFNNILGAVMLNIELARGELPSQHPAQDYLAALRGSSLRARDLVRQILAFSRQQEQQRQILRLERLVEEALKLIRAALPPNIEIGLRHTSDGPSILADSTQVHQILTNLSANAAHAMRERGGRLDILQRTVEVDEHLAAASPDLQPGRYVELAVTDTGTGMPPEILERIFDPFFTTKGPGEGTGLGLAVVHGIMKDHDGAVIVESSQGKGTTFRLYFPAVEQPVTPPPEERQPLARGQGEHVLIIDDEEPLLRVNQRTLERLGYKVTACSTPTVALNTFRSNPDAFRAVITDLAMPGMTGLELSREFLRLRPGLPIVLTTGYTTTLDNENVKTLGLSGLLFKPATAAAIGEAVHDAIYEGKAT